MAQIQNDNLEHDEYHYDMADFEDDRIDKNSESRDDENSDIEDEVDMDTPTTDTSALEARNGKDIQGIPWESLKFTRDKYRETRLKQYKNYVNLVPPCHDLAKECMEVERGGNFYNFQFNTRLVKPTITHFQNNEKLSWDWAVKGGLLIYLSFSNKSSLGVLSEQLARLVNPIHMLRDLLWTTSKHDVYLMQNYCVMHWSPQLRRGKEVLTVAGVTVPTMKRPGTTPQPLTRVQISTMVVRENLLVAGGFQGELICKNVEHPGVAFCTKISNDEDAITNAVDIYHDSYGSTRVMTANNDALVRIFDAENFACLNQFLYSWSVNNTSVSPDGKLIAVLGDSRDCLIAEAQAGKVVGNLKGHSDYSFASAWHPDGRILATGNQDTTCRLWDIRNLSQSLAVLKGRMAAIRAIKFTSDGRFMAMAEAADFVHIYDTKSVYKSLQEIDLFGEIAGISFSPDSEALFVGMADRTYGSLLEFNRRHHSHYLDSILG